VRIPKISYWPLLLGPWLSFGLGLVMNALVMAVNNGQMPVQFPGGCPVGGFGDDIIHSCMTSTTHLKFLCDWIVIRGVGIASPGDFFEWAWELTWLPMLSTWIGFIIKDQNAKVSNSLRGPSWRD
jgi:hypothetical protein